HLVGNDVDAAQDHLIERVRGERLAQQRRAAAPHRETDRRERPRPAARLYERRAAAIDDVNRWARYSAAAGRGRVVACDDTSPLLNAPRDVSSSGAKSSTAIAAETAAAAALSLPASSTVMVRCRTAWSMSR